MADVVEPPEAMRDGMDKTAKFVAANGELFEQRLRDAESDNPKFVFLKPDHPFHAYFRAKVAALSAPAVEPEAAASSTLPTPPSTEPASPPPPPRAAPVPPASPTGAAAVPAELSSAEALVGFMGALALAPHVPDFLEEEIYADEVLDLIEEELDSINGRPLGDAARAAFWLRRLLVSAAPPLVYKFGDAIEARFGSVAGVLGVGPTTLATELSKMKVEAPLIPPLLRALAPLRQAAGKAASSSSAPPSPKPTTEVQKSTELRVLAAEAQAQAMAMLAEQGKQAGDAPAGVEEAQYATKAGAEQPSAAAAAAPVPLAPPAEQSAPAAAAAAAVPAPAAPAPAPARAASTPAVRDDVQEDRAAAPAAATQAPAALPARPSPAASQARLSARMPHPSPAAPAGPAEDGPGTPTRKPLTAEQVEALKEQFRAEREIRRNAAAARAASSGAESATLRYQRELQRAKKTLQYAYVAGEGGMFATGFAPPQPAPAPPQEPPALTPALIAQMAPPTLSDEERVLQLLTDRIAAEREASIRHDAVLAAARVQETMASAMPPLRRSNFTLAEQAAMDAQKAAAAALEEPVICRIQ